MIAPIVGAARRDSSDCDCLAWEATQLEIHAPSRFVMLRKRACAVSHLPRHWIDSVLGRLAVLKLMLMHVEPSRFETANWQAAFGVHRYTAKRPRAANDRTSLRRQ